MRRPRAAAREWANSSLQIRNALAGRLVKGEGSADNDVVDHGREHARVGRTMVDLRVLGRQPMSAPATNSTRLDADEDTQRVGSCFAGKAA
jgi:hypothetical protein